MRASIRPGPKPRVFAEIHLLLIRKSEPDKTSPSELIESQQGLSVAIPILRVKCEVHIRELLTEIEFAGIFAMIAEERRFYVQLMVL